MEYDAEKAEFKTDYNAVCMAVVSAQNSALCDAYSTAAAVLGLEKGAELLSENGFDGLIFTNPDGGKGKIKVVGEWRFLDGYDKYKTDYEAV